MRLLCWMGFHTGPKYVNAWSAAPGPLRCTRCGMPRFPPVTPDAERPTEGEVG